MFKNPFSFNGRIRRLEFGLSYIIYIVYYSLVSLLIGALAEVDGSLSFLVLLMLIPALWFFFAQSAKRCHDRDNSGWYQLIPFYVFWMLFAESEYGENDYGDNPKGEGNKSEIEEIGKEDESNN
jgi:uncharacterized membrane protein YhaH (DUF805 family)